MRRPRARRFSGFPNCNSNRPSCSVDIGSATASAHVQCVLANTPTATPTVTATATVTQTATVTHTATVTNTPTSTATSTVTNTPTATPVPQGGACATPSQCGTGFCVNGVCCNTACTDPLMRCNLTNRVGICASTTAAAPAVT